ncbi:TetR/AcrR family transcriptional regulator [Bacillus pacificus]|uniref:TetR/AcrR family transcriptional regulator n=1 Tax=Bacillus pacificus TaxID=2026187 RepID=UPI002E1F8764|nr:TetR/AcrR family transcriptional regulator [Bacillus pacificus]
MSNPIFDKILAQGLIKGKTEKQQRIIETTIKLFAEKGYANTSTAEIAKVAGVSEGTIFKHYGKKDQLLLSVILPFVNDFFPNMAKELIEETMLEQTTSFEEFLRNLLKNRVAFITENKEIFRVIVKEIIYKEELKKELKPYFIEHVPVLFENIVEQFKEQGELIDLPADRILKMLFTLLAGFFVSRFVLMENHIISEEEIEDVVQFVMNGIKNK